MSLIGEERKEKIIDLLNTNGKVIVNQLAKKFKVSSETIRRHLVQLEEEGKLKRVYGGAIKVSFGSIEPPFFEREINHSEEKKVIGKIAAQMIHENDVIFLDEGSTPLQIIPHILDLKSITIITNSFSAASQLIDYSTKKLFFGKLIFLGGEVQANHFRVEGSITEKMMEQFYVDKSFISVDGISIEYGITSINSKKAMLAKKFIENSKDTTILVDHSKIGNRNHYKISDLNKIDYIVCDKPAPSDWTSMLEEYNTNWITEN